MREGHMQEKWREKSHEAVWMGHSGLEKSYMSYRPDYVGHRKSVKSYMSHRSDYVGHRELAKGYMSHQPVKAGHNQPVKNIFAICQHKHREFYNYRKLIIAQKI